MIKAVIFDYGGVVKVSHALSGDLAKIFSVSDEEVEKVKEVVNKTREYGARGLGTDYQMFGKFAKLFGKPLPENCVELAQKFYRDSFVFYPEIIDLAKKLKNSGIKTAVLSDISKFEAAVIREKNGYDFFDKLFLSYEKKISKSETEFYKLAVKSLNVRPEECIFIDDKGKNLLPAKELGIKTVLFENPKQVVQEVFNIISVG